LTFFEIQDGGRRHLGFSSRHLGFSSYVNLAHPGMLVACGLNSVPNLVQIAVVVIDIDALMFRTFI